MTFIEFLVTLEGRITRRVFWRRFFLPLAVLWLIVLYVNFVYVGSGFGMAGVKYESGGVATFFYVFAAWPIVAVSVKRLHDRNKSGWWMLAALVPFIGWIWYVVEVGLLDGTHGSNHFGPDPLERHPVQ